MKTPDAADMLYDRYVRGNPVSEARVARMRTAIRISEEIYRLRTERGLTQEQLARKIGIKSRSAIARAESADYTGQNLDLLHRIAAALGCTVNLALVPEPKVEVGKTQGTWRTENAGTATEKYQVLLGPPELERFLLPSADWVCKPTVEAEEDNDACRLAA